MLYELIPNLKSNRLPTFDCEEFPLKSVISLTNNLQGILMWEEFIDMGIQIDYHELETRQRTLSFDDPINIHLPTGSPKGATLSHHILNNGYIAAKTQRITEEDKIVIPVPIPLLWYGIGNLSCIIRSHHDLS
jgi:fatty-acyl-CoA synthase